MKDKFLMDKNSPRVDSNLLPKKEEKKRLTYELGEKERLRILANLVIDRILNEYQINGLKNLI